MTGQNAERVQGLGDDQSLPQDLLNLLRCPKTSQALSRLEQTLITDDGEEVYPLLDGVPWLLPNPQNSLMDWSVKLNHFQQVIAEEVKSLQREAAKVSGPTEQRLKLLIEGKTAFSKQVAGLLHPVLQAQAATKPIYDALRDKAPTTQNLLSYEANVYRDWVWGDEENELTAQLVSEHISKLKCDKLLVLGAGAGRLALDVHNRLDPQVTVATDINPLLVMAATRILSGTELTLHEFPMQPISSAQVALEHRISAQQKPDNYHFVFSDVCKPSFKPDFDVVLTPWLIDIQPLEFSRFLRQLNQNLSVGAHWVNFGSLVFNQKRDRHCYAIDEVIEIAVVQGFEISDIKEHDIPYLKSPYNAGYRMEHVWTWTAIKTKDVRPLKDPQNLPGWILDDKQPIPKTAYFQQFAFTHRIYAQLTAEIDCKTSLTRIAKKMAKQNRMDDAEALQTVKNFLMEVYLQNQ